MPKWFDSLLLGFRRRWRRALSAALSAFGAIWLLTEVITRVSNDANYWLSNSSTTYVIGATAIAALAFAFEVYERRSVSFTIPNTDTTLTLKFASIFEEKSNWIVGVNEFFDSTLGTIVAATSLHGQIMGTIYLTSRAGVRDVRSSFRPIVIGRKAYLNPPTVLQAFYLGENIRV